MGQVVADCAETDTYDLRDLIAVDLIVAPFCALSLYPLKPSQRTSFVVWLQVNFRRAQLKCRQDHRVGVIRRISLLCVEQFRRPTTQLDALLPCEPVGIAKRGQVEPPIGRPAARTCSSLAGSTRPSRRPVSVIRLSESQIRIFKFALTAN